jgi:hypothetical protein
MIDLPDKVLDDVVRKKTLVNNPRGSNGKHSGHGTVAIPTGVQLKNETTNLKKRTILRQCNAIILTVVFDKTEPKVKHVWLVNIER